MKALILAAGEGKRLFPFTATRSKTMLPIAGKPLIGHLIDTLKKVGITDFVFVVNHKKEDLMDYINGLKLHAQFMFQEKIEGTGAAVLSAKNILEEEERFLITPGDIVVEPGPIRKLIEYGRFAVLVKKIERDIGRYGVVEVRNEKIVSVEEKPANPISNTVSTSIILGNKTLLERLSTINRSPRGEIELPDVFVGADAIELEGFWMDVGYPWDILSANSYFLKNMEHVAGKIENSTIKGKVVMEDGAEVFDSYVEGNVYIGKDTKIGPHAYIRGDTSIGQACKIGESTTVKNAVLFDNVMAKHLSYIGDSVIGENVNFGSGTQLANYRFDEKEINVLVNGKWVNSGRKKLGAFVGDWTKFGVLSCVMPGKIIGPNCWIGSGVTVGRNIGENKRMFNKENAIIK